MTTEQKLKEAIDEAYKKAGPNAYFENGFRAGVEYAEQFDMFSTLVEYECDSIYQGQIGVVKGCSMVNYWVETDDGEDHLWSKDHCKIVE